MSDAPPAVGRHADRFDRLDALRGLALVWMAVFHFCFDLAHLGLVEGWNLYRDPFWTRQRTVIVTLFLLCAGFGQAIAHAQHQRWPRFWRRWGQVAGCALLVSAGSWLMFPDSYIRFGVLHGIALMLIVVRLSAGWGRWLWPLGALALLAPQGLRHEFFNQPLLDWTGLVTRKPITEDYVPLLPWLGVMWWGMALGQTLLAHRPRWLSGPLARPLRPLAVLGRWSLSFYMLHQPVLIGLLLAWRAVRA
jgi:uncharacterized membrane protein